MYTHLHICCKYVYHPDILIFTRKKNNIKKDTDIPMKGSKEELYDNSCFIDSSIIQDLQDMLILECGVQKP